MWCPLPDRGILLGFSVCAFILLKKLIVLSCREYGALLERRGVLIGQNHTFVEF